MSRKNKEVPLPKDENVEPKQNTNKQMTLKDFLRLIGGNDASVTSATELNRISLYNKKIEEVIEDALILNPDIELAMEILSSLIESPNDMQEPNLVFKLNNVNIPSSIITSILDITKDYVYNEYKFLDKIDEYVKNALFYKGAHVELIIHPKDVYDLVKTLKHNITVANEDIINSFNGKVNLLSNTSKSSSPNDVVKVTDNYFTLLEDELSVMKFKKRTSGVVTKSSTEKNDLLIAMEDAIIDRDNGIVQLEVGEYDELEKPLVKDLEPRRVIPIYKKENPSIHYGYFVLTEDEVKDSKSSNGQVLNITNGGKPKGKLDEYLEQIKKNLSYMTGSAPELNNVDDFRDKILKNKIQNILKNMEIKNVIDEDIKIPDEVVLTAMDIIVKKSRIKLIYVPEDMISYIAVKHKNNGTGESLLEKVLMLLSIRGIIMFTKLLSYIKSSVTTTVVNVELDEADNNYRSTMEMIKAEIIKNRQISLPIGEVNPARLTDWVHKLGFSFNFKHPNLPEMAIDISEQTNEINPIDDTIKEDIDRQIYNALYLTPEIISDALGPDFATTVIANRLLLTKRISKLQSKFNVKFTDNIRKKLRLDGKFKDKIRTLILGNKKEIKSGLKKKLGKEYKKQIDSLPDDVLVNWLFNIIVDNITVALPKPESSEMENMTNIVNDFTDTLENVMDKIFSEDAIPSELAGALGDKISNVKAALSTMIIIKFLNERNLLPEITRLFALDEDGNPIFNTLEEFNNYINTLTKVLEPFLKSNKKLQKDIEKAMNKVDNEDEENEESDNDTDNENSEDNSKNDSESENNTDEENNEDEDNENTEDNKDNNKEEPKEDENNKEEKNDENTNETNEDDINKLLNS